MRKSVMMILSCLIVFSMVFAGFAENPFINGEELNYRIAGANRYETSYRIAMEKYGEKGAETLILVRGDSEEGVPQVVDALSASGIAGVKKAPIMINPKDRLHDMVVKAINDLGVKEVLIVGGTMAISEEVEDELLNLKDGITCHRIEGRNRYYTAAEVAKQVLPVSESRTVLLAGGDAYVDALVAGSYAHEKGVPILLTGQHLNLATKEILLDYQIENIIIVGGPAVVPESVREELEDLVSGTVKRVEGTDEEGKNRFGTSIRFAKEYFEDTQEMLLVNGFSFVDAVPASILGKPILYTRNNDMHDSIEQLLKEKLHFWAVGGSAVLSEHLVEQAMELVGTEADFREDPEIIEWPVAGGITYGEPLGESDLSGGEADVAGSFIFADEELLLDAGEHEVDIIFSPDDEDGYRPVEGTVMVTVAKAQLEVSADPQEKTYGDQDPELTYEITEGELVGNDELSGELNREAGEDTGSYAITQGSLSAGVNYAMTFVGEDFTIHPRALTILADDIDKVYGEDDPELTYEITDGELIGEDSLQGELEREPGEDAGDYEILLGSVDAGSNYTITFTKGTFSINPKPLTVRADDIDKVYGEDDPEFSVEYSEFAPGETEAVLEGTLEFEREPGEDVGEYSITPSGISSSNYEITFVEGTLDIRPKPLIITADDGEKVYGEDDPQLTASYSEFAFDEDESDLEGIIELLREDGEDVGQYRITPSGVASDNYLISFADGTFTVDPRPITVKGDELSKIYGENDPALTYTITEGNLVGDDKLSGGLSRAPGENTGVYGIEQDSLTAGENYDLTFIDGELSILPKSLSITALDQTKIYGEEDPQFAADYSGFAFDEDKSVLEGVLSFDRETGEGVGTYDITPEGLSSSNYDITYVEGELTINRKPLTVRADDVNKVYGEDDPEFSVEYSEFAFNETEAVLEGDLEFEREPGQHVGEYSITPSGLSSSNYAITFVDGTLVIDKAELHVTADDKTKLVDQPDPVFTASYNGFVPGEDQEVLDGVLEFTREPGEEPGDYDITPGGLTAENYNITYHSGILTILDFVPEGMLQDAVALEDSVAVIYGDGNKLIYAEVDASGAWDNVYEIGEGKEGVVDKDNSGNPHIVYVTSHDGYDAIAYRKFDGEAWSAQEIISSNGDANCSKPDLAIDSLGNAHITYTDPRGNSASYSDIMYATNRTGEFEKEVIMIGSHGNTGFGWISYFYNKGSKISVDDQDNYYILYHEQYRDRNSWGDTFNSYRIRVINGPRQVTELYNSSTDNSSVYEFKTTDGELYALYRGGTVTVDGISVFEGSITDVQQLIQTDESSDKPYSLALMEGATFIGTVEGENLKVLLNEAIVLFDEINISGNRVSLIPLNGKVYAVYTEVETGNITIWEIDIPTYELTLEAEPAYGGEVLDLTDGGPYSEGQEVTIRAEANAGYVFSHWEAEAGHFEDAQNAETIFTMPGEDVTVSAVFYFEGQSNFSVDPINNVLWGHYWEENAELTIHINGAEYMTTTGDSDMPWVGPSDFLFSDPGLEIHPGDLILVSDGVITKGHVVRYLEIIDVDSKEDIVFGTAEPEAELTVEIMDDPEAPVRQVTADQAGDWNADFSTGDETYTIDENTGIVAFITDHEGDQTRIFWHPEHGPDDPEPNITATVMEGGVISGYNWPEDDFVNVVVERDGTIIYDDDEPTDLEGYFNIRISGTGEYLMAGDHIRVRSDEFDIEQTMTVAYIEVTEVDADQNRLAGKADPSQSVKVMVFQWEQDHIIIEEIPSDSDGNWNLNLEGIYQLQPGDMGSAEIVDAHGNSTAVYWNVRIPGFAVYPEEGFIQGFDWLPNGNVTISINNGEPLLAPTDDYGYFHFTVEIQAGDTVVVSDGETMMSHVVADLSIENVNWDTGEINGMGDSNSQIHLDLVTYPGYGPPNVIETMILTADSDGKWSYTFSEEIPEDAVVELYFRDSEGAMTLVRLYRDMEE